MTGNKVPLEPAIPDPVFDAIIELPSEDPVFRGPSDSDDLVCSNSACGVVLLPGFTMDVAEHAFIAKARMVARCKTCGTMSVIPSRPPEPDEVLR